MTIVALDALQRTRLDWPEPLVIEMIAEIYRDASAHDDIWTAARLHAHFLRDLIEGETRLARTARLKVIASCAARGIDPASVERAEQAVFRELTELAQARFRNSTRHRIQVVAKLQSAQDALTKRPEAPRKPPIKSVAPQRTRSSLYLEPSLVPAG